MKLATFILLADPQVGWNEVQKDMGNLDILNQGLNKIGAVQYPVPAEGVNITCSGSVGKPDAVFFAGDLTNYGGQIDGWEWNDHWRYNASNYGGGTLLKKFRSLYDPNYDPKWGDAKVTPLTKSGPLYFGLGNHDLFNRTCEPSDIFCPWFVWFDFNGSGSTEYTDYYRYQMWNFINQMHTGYRRELQGGPYVETSPPYQIPPSNIDSDPNGTFWFQNYSFNYFIDLGPVDVYQLHDFGGDDGHVVNNGIHYVYNRKSGLDWLKRKLAARGYTRPVFLVQHLPVACSEEGYWNDTTRDQLFEILRPYNVLGVGVGHDHITKDIREVWPSSSITGVFNEQHIYQVLPGAAHKRLFAVIRVEESLAGDEVILNVLYGEVDLATSTVTWNKGWHTRTPKEELYVKDIEVVYVNKAANDHSTTLPWYVTEESDKSANINEGFGGAYVYIKPILTNNTNDATTGFDLLIQDCPYTGPLTGVRDLAHGTNGKYRYLIPKCECGKPPMRQLFLWRPDGKQSSRIGWELSPNVNEGRGDPLYLEWESR